MARELERGGRGAGLVRGIFLSIGVVVSAGCGGSAAEVEAFQPPQRNASSCDPLLPGVELDDTLCEGAVANMASLDGPMGPLAALGTWEDRGPSIGGRLDAIFVRQVGAQRRILVGSPGGGVWRSDDNGANWYSASAGLTELTVTHIEADLLDPLRIYALT